MKRTIVQSPRAEADLAEYYAFIAGDKIEPAERLLEVANQAFERLAEYPRLGRPWRAKRAEVEGLYFYPLPAPYRSYLIFYRFTDKILDVVRVLHGALDIEKAFRKSRD